jgi:hypothetical protein
VTTRPQRGVARSASSSQPTVMVAALTMLATGIALYDLVLLAVGMN